MSWWRLRKMERATVIEAQGLPSRQLLVVVVDEADLMLMYERGEE